MVTTLPVRGGTGCLFGSGHDHLAVRRPPAGRSTTFRPFHPHPHAIPADTYRHNAELLRPIVATSVTLRSTSAAMLGGKVAGGKSGADGSDRGHDRKTAKQPAGQHADQPQRYDAQQHPTTYDRQRGYGDQRAERADEDADRVVVAGGEPGGQQLTGVSPLRREQHAETGEHRASRGDGRPPAVLPHAARRHLRWPRRRTRRSCRPAEALLRGRTAPPRSPAPAGATAGQAAVLRLRRPGTAPRRRPPRRRARTAPDSAWRAPGWQPASCPAAPPAERGGRPWRPGRGAPGHGPIRLRP